MSINQFFAGDFQKHIEAISAEYDRVCEVNAGLRQKMQEWRKDDEIQKLEKEIAEVRRHSIHIVTDVELDEINKFRNQHRQSCKKYDFGFFLTGTGLGTGIDIQCMVCGEKKDVTDFGAW